MIENFQNSEHPSAGSFTSGGTESIILACKAYRSVVENAYYISGNYCM